VQMPRAKASVRTILAWGERKVAGGAAARATPVEPVRHTGQTGAGLARHRAGFVPVSLGLFLGSWFWWLVWRVCRWSVC
jgi:hypothetical protein